MTGKQILLTLAVASFALFVATRAVFGGELIPVPPVNTTVNLNSCQRCNWSVRFQQFRCKWCWLEPVAIEAN